MVARGEIEEDPSFQRALIKKASKSLSGVLVVTVLTSPCVLPPSCTLVIPTQYCKFFLFIKIKFTWVHVCLSSRFKELSFCFLDLHMLCFFFFFFSRMHMLTMRFFVSASPEQLPGSRRQKATLFVRVGLPLLPQRTRPAAVLPARRAERPESEPQPV